MTLRCDFKPEKDEYISKFLEGLRDGSNIEFMQIQFGFHNSEDLAKNIGYLNSRAAFVRGSKCDSYFIGLQDFLYPREREERFPRFSDLPSELRDKIWKLAVEEPAVVYMAFTWIGGCDASQEYLDKAGDPMNRLGYTMRSFRAHDMTPSHIQPALHYGRRSITTRSGLQRDHTAAGRVTQQLSLACIRISRSSCCYRFDRDGVGKAIAMVVEEVPLTYRFSARW